MNRSLIASAFGLAFLVSVTASAQTFEQITQARSICRQFGFQPTTESFANCVMQMTFRLRREDRCPGAKASHVGPGASGNAALFAAVKGIGIVETEQRLREVRGPSY